MTTQTRQQEIQSIHKEYPRFNFVALGIIVLLMGILIGFYLVESEFLNGNYPTGLYTELISIIITIVVLDQINDYRDTQRLKRRLVGEAGSQSNETAKSAIDWMRREGWLTGSNGLLKGANLRGANLRDVKLTGANLAEINLQGANLINAQLNSSDLSKADLRGANLTKANLSSAKLKESKMDFAKMGDVIAHNTDFTKACLQDAYLEKAELFGADFTETNLNRTNCMNAEIILTKFIGADLKHAMFFNNYRDRVTLPNGKLWLKDDDIERFTDPENPDF